MARVRKGERLGATEDGRVTSEHFSGSLVRGTKDKLKLKAAEERTRPSRLIQEALDSWIFHPRRKSPGTTPRRSKGKPRG